MRTMIDNGIKIEIPLLVMGYDFKTASSALREKLVTRFEDRNYLLDSIRQIDNSAGFFVLETCNRFEWIVSTQFPWLISDILSSWMLSRWGKTPPRGNPPISFSLCIYR